MNSFSIDEKVFNNSTSKKELIKNHQLKIINYLIVCCELLGFKLQQFG